MSLRHNSKGGGGDQAALGEGERHNILIVVLRGCFQSRSLSKETNVFQEKWCGRREVFVRPHLICGPNWLFVLLWAQTYSGEWCFHQEKPWQNAPCALVVYLCLLIHLTPELWSYNPNASSLRGFSNQFSPLWGEINEMGFTSATALLWGDFVGM